MPYILIIFRNYQDKRAYKEERIWLPDDHNVLETRRTALLPLQAVRRKLDHPGSEIRPEGEASDRRPNRFFLPFHAASKESFFEFLTVRKLETHHEKILEIN